MCTFIDQASLILKAIEQGATVGEKDTALAMLADTVEKCRHCQACGMIGDEISGRVARPAQVTAAVAA